MSQQSLQDLLNAIKKDYAKEYDQAASGVAPNGNWDIDLPVTLEYRALVTKSEYGNSKSGKPQITLTYEIQEPAEYKGAMIQQYVDPNPTQTWATESLAKLFGALRADLNKLGDFDEFVADFVDKTVVLATNKWGEAMDRNGVRYVNADRGQTLKTDVKPPKQRGGTNASLRPDISIPKQGESAPPSAPPSAPAESSAPLPGGAQSSGVNLPPGLRS